MEYLASAAKSGAAGSGRGVRKTLLDANPILEGFGNAKTLRNNNSSRFGKWTAVNISGSGRILSANITQYLLEKSRVTFQSEGERNYHVLYQAFAACARDPVWAQQLGLSNEPQVIATSDGARGVCVFQSGRRFSIVGPPTPLLSTSSVG